MLWTILKMIFFFFNIFCYWLSCPAFSIIWDPSLRIILYSVGFGSIKESIYIFSWDKENRIFIGKVLNRMASASGELSKFDVIPGILYEELLKNMYTKEFWEHLIRKTSENILYKNFWKFETVLQSFSWNSDLSPLAAYFKRIGNCERRYDNAASISIY